LDCSVDKKLGRIVDYDENECQCLECHQKRKYARGKRIHGHEPPVDVKRSYFWYQISCADGDASRIQYYALCPYTQRFTKSTLRPDIAMRSPPFVIRPESKECDQGKECHNTQCPMCQNKASETSKELKALFGACKDSL